MTTHRAERRRRVAPDSLVLIALLLAFGLRLQAATGNMTLALTEEERVALAYARQSDVWSHRPDFLVLLAQAVPDGSPSAQAAFVGRALTAFAGALTGAVGYRLTRGRGLSRGAGVAVALALAVFPDAVVYGSRFHTAPWAALFVLLALLAAERAYRRLSFGWTLANLAVSALAVYALWPLWPLLVMSVIVGLWLYSRNPSRARLYRFVMLLLVAVVWVVPVGALPASLQAGAAGDPLALLEGWNFLAVFARIGPLLIVLAVALTLWFRHKRLQGAGFWGLTILATGLAAAGYATGGHLPVIIVAVTWAVGAVVGAGSAWMRRLAWVAVAAWLALSIGWVF